VVERVQPGSVLKDWKPGTDLFNAEIKSLA
jgi:hypothetical protein